MAEEREQKKESDLLQFSTFYLNEQLCGINIKNVQEIDEDLTITKVPLSPDYVLGIMNLRGQIITVIDQNIKLGFPPSEIGKKSRIIIVLSKGEYIGLLVDRIDEVIMADKNSIKLPPSNIRGMQGKFFEGVYNTETEGILALINIEAILSDESAGYSGN